MSELDRPTTPQITVLKAPTPIIKRGVVYILFAFEVGLSINLDLASSRVKDSTERAKFRRNRKTPKYFDYDPPPLRISQHGKQINIGKFFTKPQADITLFDFGACSVCYEADVSGPLSHLIELSDVLYDNAYLLADAKERVELLVREIGSAVNRARLAESVEDFTIYHLEELEGDHSSDVLLEKYAKDFSRVLRSETEELSPEEVKDALVTRTSYSIADCTVIDWNAGILFGKQVEDVVSVLEFCNVELLEMRFLDEQLDDYLEQAYETMTTGKRGGADLEKIARLQVDSAILYEAVENAVKLLGDQYLARVYSHASNKLHLHEWNSSIRRKLDTLDSIYQKLSDRAEHRRSHFLEMIIIALILFEIVMSLAPQFLR